ncbi:MAG TPA: energy-coupled thiamine transporter ThiT [Bacillota bacterium]|nr:energy-coupled thiamine transporter ThiT [Bacillota bacterium]HPF42426.1 energy-coupled thiamine transporter ThiT [Bacillota bacterium]HPJ85441.1 energy-coupled thiamine transporter ThiT [Bacillota bacterium]HPQ61263.1 energy-coupled thiamine transporter ThiT [Bacillota bacterium]HRX91661.1 energy-coupled thiamine transporter ThiT [Candidatus Izemoplasmatales bacterium]
MKRNQTLLALLETGIMVAIAVILDAIFGAIYTFPFGGSITPAMFPIFFLAARRGVKYGLLGGLLYGSIQLMFSIPYILSLPQFLMDYIVSFTVLGFSGLIPGQLEKGGRFVLGILLGTVLRLISASIAGLLFWVAYIPEELDFMHTLFGVDIAGFFASDNAAVLFGAFAYNMLYLVPSFIICALIGVIFQKRGLLKFRLEG